MFAWKRPPITSASYPYVRSWARGRSDARYSSGQKTVVGGSVNDEEIVDEAYACFVLVNGDQATRRFSKDLKPLCFSVAPLL